MEKALASLVAGGADILKYVPKDVPEISPDIFTSRLTTKQVLGLFQAYKAWPFADESEVFSETPESIEREDVFAWTS